MSKRIIKNRCSGLLTESAFWSMIRSHLRRLSLRWKPRNEYITSVRKPYKGPDKRLKWLYQCEQCHEWFARKEVEADHKVEAGSLKCSEDVGPFIDRLLVEVDGWRILCRPCHKERTRMSLGDLNEY